MMHFLAYADNYTPGYFQKQRFTKDITLNRSIWMSLIKDFEDSTLIQAACFSKCGVEGDCSSQIAPLGWKSHHTPTGSSTG